MVKRLDGFAGVDLGSSELVDPIASGTEQAERIALRARAVRERRYGERQRRDPLLQSALSASLSSVNALLAASSATCQRDSPPAEIDLVSDASGRLIYRCQHADAHEWTLDGSTI